MKIDWYKFELNGTLANVKKLRRDETIVEEMIKGGL